MGEIQGQQTERPKPYGAPFERHLIYPLQYFKYSVLLVDEARTAENWNCNTGTLWALFSLHFIELSLVRQSVPYKKWVIGVRLLTF